MKKKWIIEGWTGGEIVYLRVTKDRKRALVYLEECRELLNDCRLKKGEFYTLEEAEDNGV
ncbi:hypothetical protein [Metallosphaera sedula]|uniref:hypothetical protein n=1 Tax=Metallosphaera sedula TaxID=43687 RepID=UPI0020BF0E9A|nr:hypothetical protein [Metallosphaera sedula]BBL46077.1 hypothetical protein MJ1HA_0169 [Metallosphaera sedula]